MQNKNNYHIYLFLLFLFFSPLSLADTTIIPDAKLNLKHTQKSPDTPLSTTQFSAKQITKSPVINLNDFLKQEQSVVRLTNNSGDNTQTALSLRGFGDNAAANSLILIDGFPLTNPSLLAPNFNSIPLTDIDHIDILQGSQGSLWGDQAVGGVVNIVTKHPSHFFTNAILSAGSYNTYYDNILIGNKNSNNTFYKLFALVGKTDNYRDHNRQNSNNVAMQIGKEYARGRVSFNLQSYADTIYFPGGLSLEQFLDQPQQATEFHNYSRYRTTLFQLLNQHSINNDWTLETRLSYQETKATGFVFMHFDRSDSQLNFHPRIIGTWKKNKIIAGYTGQLSQYELTNLRVNPRTQANQENLYTEITIPINEKLDLILGARKAWQMNHIVSLAGESTHATNQVFVTEQGLMLHLSPTLTLFIRRDGNFSFPKANEDTWVPNNMTSLQVQTGVSYETGIQWQTEKWQTQFSLYRLDLHDEIAFDPTETIEEPFGAFTNLDDTRRNGASLSGRYIVNKRLSVNAQFNYVKARFVSGLFAGDTIPAVPAITGNAGLDYAFTERWHMQYNALYTGSKYASEDLANTGKRIGAYWLNDIALQYVKEYFIISAEVRNVLNTNYASYVFYDAFSKQNEYYPAAGRNFSLTIKINI